MSGQANRKRCEGLLHRHEKVQMEWAQQRRLEDLVEWRRVAAEVEARTGGRCYWPGCSGRITAYPHAVPHWEGGVHGMINRAGLCNIHVETVHSVCNGAGPPREFLRRWLQSWYAERGMPAERWLDLATGGAVATVAD